MKDRDLMWLDKSIIEAVKSFDDDAEKANEVAVVILRNLRSEVETFTEDIEERFAVYRRIVKKVKEGFEEVVKAEIEGLYEFWEELDKKRTEINRKIDATRQGFADVRADIKQTRDALSNVNLYGADKTLEILERFSRMSDSEKELFAKLLEINKKES